MLSLTESDVFVIVAIGCWAIDFAVVFAFSLAIVIPLFASFFVSALLCSLILGVCVHRRDKKRQTSGDTTLIPPEL